MEFHQLRYFLAVVEASGFSRAAERCGVAQPSLSQQIKKLEEELGHRLFDRLPRGAALTEAGRALLPRARRIVGEANQVRGAIDADLETGCGPLFVGAIPTMAPYVFPPLIKRFVGLYPACTLTIQEDVTDRLVALLLEHKLDIAILSPPVDNELIQLDVLGRERLLLVQPVQRPGDDGREVASLSDLRDRPAVVLHDMHCLNRQTEAFCSSRRISRKIVCRTAQLSTVLQLVGTGLGVSLVPEMCACCDDSPLRQYRRIGKSGPVREIAAAHHVDRTLSRLSRSLIEMLRENLAFGIHSMK